MKNKFSQSLTENFRNQTVLKEDIIEENRAIKYLINFTILFGALGFLITGISSFYKTNFIIFLNSDEILFFPQGLTMCFYGICGITIGVNQLRILILKIGEGYNKFDKEKGTMEIFRKGFKGNDSDIKIIYPLSDILR
jgi:hypothetical protein